MSHRFLLHHVEIQQAKVNANKEPSQDQNQKYCLCRRRNCFNARTQLRFTAQINLYSASWNIHVLRDCAVLDVVPPLLYRIVSHLWKKLPKARKKSQKFGSFVFFPRHRTVGRAFRTETGNKLGIDLSKWELEWFFFHFRQCSLKPTNWRPI